MMRIIGSTVTQIVALLNANSASLNGSATAAFPTTKISYPLNENLFAVGVLSSSLGKRIVVTEGDERVETHNRPLSVTYSVTIYSPASLSGSALLSTFDKVIDCIVHTGNYNVSSAGCGDIEYSTVAKANVLKAFFTLSSVVSDLT